MKYLTTVFVLLFSLPSSAEELEIEVLNDNIVFHESGDPGWMRLRDTNGEFYEAEFFYKFISFKNISKWKKNEALKLVFVEGKGLGILRDADGQFYKLYFNGGGPIQAEEDKCQENPQAYVRHWNDCLVRSEQMWDTEYQFYFEYLTKNSSPELADAVIKFDESWVNYRKAFFKAFGTHAEERGGSIYRTYAAVFDRDLAKEKTKLLLSFLQ